MLPPTNPITSLRFSNQTLSTSFIPQKPNIKYQFIYTSHLPHYKKTPKQKCYDFQKKQQPQLKWSLQQYTNIFHSQQQSTPKLPPTEKSTTWFFRVTLLEVLSDLHLGNQRVTWKMLATNFWLKQNNMEPFLGFPNEVWCLLQAFRA